ncbi:MAG TPA: Calx-beta domain-containing protein [Pyrinomonadaceae bacterium]|nr:Calx-beta domain-containing protein [Pyrinomonadaceae bacterium]
MKTTLRLNNLLISLILTIMFFAAAAQAATFQVTNTNDSGVGSLRQAMINANNDTNTNSFILFNFAGGGVQTINLQSPLPVVSLDRAECGVVRTLTIDATSMPGYAGIPRIELNGASAGNAANGLSIARGLVTVKGIAINRFALWGIYVANEGQANPQCAPPGTFDPLANLNLYGSRIGTDANGTLDLGNGIGGVVLNVNSGPSNFGGSTAAERNIISGNGGDGVYIPSAHDVHFRNNLIGTNSAGTAALPNTGKGINAVSIWDIYIGTGLSADRNIVSGNGGDGINITVQPNRFGEIKGNYIGTNLAGTGDLGNGANGVVVNGSINPAGLPDVLVGGHLAGEGNVISGNTENGIRANSPSLKVYGNLVGTNAAGTAAVGNTLDGIRVVQRAEIGTATSGYGNFISGNGDDGVQSDFGAFHTGTNIVGNRIGIGPSGLVLPNGGNGVRVNSDYTDVWDNVISGNTDHGVLITGSLENELKRNFIGTNSANADLGNGGDGVRVAFTVESAQIGDAGGFGNVIAYNNGDGINLQPGFAGAGAHNVAIRANSVYLNSGLGIDLGPTDGVTPNDQGDADSGPNGVQNFPVLQAASAVAINGTLNSTANTQFVIDFYRVDSCDASGYGEGKYYLGSTNATTNASGNVNFTGTNFNLVLGQTVVATATTFSTFPYETSEFSQCLVVAQNPGDVKLSAATYSANESNPTAVIIVTRNGGSSGTITVDYSTSNGTAIAGQDYTATSGTLTFANGESGKLISIPIINDASDEPDETLNFTLSNPTGGATLLNPSAAVVTLSDNDNPPTVSVNDISVIEGNENLTPFTFTISLSQASAFATSVNWSTAAGTANATSDFQTSSGTVNFAAGEVSKQVTVQVYGETLVEINETFSVNLSTPLMSTIGDGTGIATILDDDSPGKFSFSLAPYNASEASGPVTVTVVRTNGGAGTATVDYATSGGTATPFADFTPASGTLIVLDGETQKTFTVPVLEDQIAEQTESINLVLSSPTGGATLGVMAAVVNILDNDSGTPLAISGAIKKSDNTPLAGATVNLTGTHNTTTTTDANGEYSFSSLTPAGSYAVTPSAIGYTFTPINHQYANLSASVTNARFTATPAPSRALRVVGSDTIPGQTATAIVELVAQGDENTVGFSLNFDPAVLSNPQVVLSGDAASGSLIVNDSQAAGGKLGVIVAMPAGQVLTAGTRQVASVTFSSVQTNLYSTPLNFGDTPVQKQIVNVNADPLPAAYTNGSVTFAQGFEADVAPRPTGSMNGSVTVADFTQIGRFVAGLNTPDQTNEFQRSDVAPRISKGNGLLTVSDYTQAGRYAAGLDPVQTAGGAVAASLAAPELREASSPESTLRTIKVVDTQTGPGLQVFVPIKIESQGDENSFGFSLAYDGSKLSNPVITLGADAPGATLIANTTQAGKVGVLLGLPAGASLAAGERHLVSIRFDVAANAAPGQIPLTFGDQPIAREVVDADVNVLVSGYTDGSVTVLGPTAAPVSVGGRVTDAAGRGIANAIVTISDSDGMGRKTATGSFGLFAFEGIEIGRLYVLTVHSNRYQFDPDTQFVMIRDEVANINFTAQPLGTPPGRPEEER